MFFHYDFRKNFFILFVYLCLYLLFYVQKSKG